MEIKDIRFVTLAGPSSAELESAFAAVGGRLSVCDLKDGASRTNRDHADFANRVLTGDIDTVPNGRWFVRRDASLARVWNSVDGFSGCWIGRATWQ